MPVSEHFGGSGGKVMAAMLRTYKDPKKAKRVFYATEQKMKGKMSQHLNTMKASGKLKSKKKKY